MSDGITDAYRGMRRYDRELEIRKELFETDEEFVKDNNRVAELNKEIDKLQFLCDKHKQAMDTKVKKIYKEKYPGCW